MYKKIIERSKIEELDNSRELNVKNKEQRTYIF